MTSLKFGWMICILSAAVSAVVLQQMPVGAELPLHWDFTGTPDGRYGPAWQGLFMPSAFIAFVLFIISALKWLEPRQENLKKSRIARGGVVLAVIVMAIVLQSGMVALALGYDVEMERLVLFAVALMLTVMGNFLGKIRSNFFIGIRTPWTLSNDDIWRKTHRLGGKLFVLCGLILAFGSWLLEERNLEYLVVVTVISAVLFPVIYSWWLWRREIS